jgi:hypothetical protein
MNVRGTPICIAGALLLLLLWTPVAPAEDPLWKDVTVTRVAEELADVLAEARADRW